jgi:hypothetical protein
MPQEDAIQGILILCGSGVPSYSRIMRATCADQICECLLVAHVAVQECNQLALPLLALIARPGAVPWSGVTMRPTLP